MAPSRVLLLLLYFLLKFFLGGELRRMQSREPLLPVPGMCRMSMLVSIEFSEISKCSIQLNGDFTWLFHELPPAFPFLSPAVPCEFSQPFVYGVPAFPPVCANVRPLERVFFLQLQPLWLLSLPGDAAVLQLCLEAALLVPEERLYYKLR